jgi:hypothetical protein
LISTYQSYEDFAPLSWTFLPSIHENRTVSTLGLDIEIPLAH